MGRDRVEDWIFGPSPGPRSLLGKTFSPRIRKHQTHYYRIGLWAEILAPLEGLSFLGKCRMRIGEVASGWAYPRVR